MPERPYNMVRPCQDQFSTIETKGKMPGEKRVYWPANLIISSDSPCGRGKASELADNRWNKGLGRINPYQKASDKNGRALPLLTYSHPLMICKIR